MGLDWDKIREEYAKKATPRELGAVGPELRLQTKRKVSSQPPQKQPQYDRQKIVSLYQQGWTVPKIAAELGCHRQTVYSAIQAAGVRKRDDRKALPGRPRQDVCRNGHRRTEENTKVNASGTRRCLDCDRKREARRRSDGTRT